MLFKGTGGLWYPQWLLPESSSCAYYWWCWLCSLGSSTVCHGSPPNNYYLSFVVNNCFGGGYFRMVQIPCFALYVGPPILASIKTLILGVCPMVSFYFHYASTFVNWNSVWEKDVPGVRAGWKETKGVIGNIDNSVNNRKRKRCPLSFISLFNHLVP